MRWNKSFLALAAILAAGCASTTPALDAHSVHFGEAVAQNIEAQRIAPTSDDKTNVFIPPNRARQKAAREAYENGTVKDPIPVGTTGGE